MKKNSFPFSPSTGQKILFYTGLVILIFAILLVIYAYLFSNVYVGYAELMLAYMIYFVGALLILIPYHSRKNIFLVVLPVILYFSSGFIYQAVQRTRVSYILPHHYDTSKPFIVVLGEKGSITPKKDGWRWILKIPEDGILVIDTVISDADDTDKRVYIQNADKTLKKLDPENFNGYIQQFETKESTEVFVEDFGKITDTLTSNYCVYNIFENEENSPSYDEQKVLERHIAQKVDSYRRKINATKKKDL
ncbi:hypothetical protein N0B40_18905 [Chryseobacterium oranimense]|uniref:hypothetical protein n=1 Tax=Chryseobacterium oranimense TaxID=421058 RepID=UPI0021B051C5|nr:hypothetical protein [Chryseobacterium oranimense]UWX60448.1 hypothetical protein N0B40_18905 [Chryseobacterium oranimense]